MTTNKLDDFRAMIAELRLEAKAKGDNDFLSRLQEARKLGESKGQDPEDFILINGIKLMSENRAKAWLKTKDMDLDVSKWGL